ncbi:hypothetical protein GCM10018773_36050 [Streptomyces candidus]|nr:hypothetical protein GCM10018773_36050 [Streptomyces candidus]
MRRPAKAISCMSPRSYGWKTGRTSTTSASPWTRCPPAKAAPATNATAASSGTPTSSRRPNPRRTAAYFTRRTFYLLPHDRPNRPDDPTCPYKVGSPLEAVYPATIAPGEPGRKTSRSQATPTDTGIVA